MDQATKDRTSTQGNTTRDARSFNVQTIATYTNPITALHLGKPVRIIATGDAPGHSSVDRIVHNDGRMEWVESNDLRVFEPNCLPPNGRALRDVSSNLDV